MTFRVSSICSMFWFRLEGARLFLFSACFAMFWKARAGGSIRRRFFHCCIGPAWPVLDPLAAHWLLFSDKCSSASWPKALSEFSFSQWISWRSCAGCCANERPACKQFEQSPLVQKSINMEWKNKYGDLAPSSTGVIRNLLLIKK